MTGLFQLGSFGGAIFPLSRLAASADRGHAVTISGAAIGGSAMGGTLEPEETPGGGLTMVICMPAAPGRPAAVAGGACQVRAA